MNSYQSFLESKVAIVQNHDGYQLDREHLHKSCLPHQADIIEWNVKGARRANFLSFGLGKTQINLETARIILEYAKRQKNLQDRNGKWLIVCPLGVKHQFIHEDGKRLGIPVEYVRTDKEAQMAVSDIVITNYERVRDGNIDPARFVGASLDEGSVLRNYGTKTTQTFISKFSSVPFRFVFTATPAPNRLDEIVHYATFLGVAGADTAWSRFFKRDSTKAGNPTLYPHKQEEFWLWVASWALFLEKPSDLGYSDEGYDLPELKIHWHRLPVDHKRAWNQVDKRSGQRRLILDAAAGLSEAAQEKSATIQKRIGFTADLIAQSPDDSWIVWHHLEDERKAIQQALPNSRAVYGSQKMELSEQLLIDFAHGKYQILSTKPQIAGSGCNFQHYCHKNIFVGVRYQFEEMIQAIHRTFRYQQKHDVECHFIYMESEDQIVDTLKRKWEQHYTMTRKMKAIIKKYGLTTEAMKGDLTRSMGVTRDEVSGDTFKLVLNDCVEEVKLMSGNSVDCIISSFPFSKLFEYSPSYRDFGHNESDESFFAQMDYLVPELLRITKPGRMACIHVKEIIVPGATNGLGVPTITRFPDKTVDSFEKHGWIYYGRICVVTDVVRENAQTYRLGHSENMKDSSKMGNGLPEYILLFRKLPSDTQNAYADDPVQKVEGEYNRGQWQVDASALYRSSGDTLLEPHDLMHLPLAEVRKRFIRWAESGTYNYDEHVKLANFLAEAGKLPTGFNLLPLPTPQTDMVWSENDYTRVRTLNTLQAVKGLQQHVCPLPLDLVSRLIGRYSMEGETVFDPFAGIGTVPYQAVNMGRYGLGCELSETYWAIATGHCEQAEAKRKVPTLFDWVGMGQKDEVMV
jgi:hypothetical protein